MSLEVSVNLNSLNLIRAQLDECIKQSATNFEAFLVDKNNREHLQSCHQAIAQVAGIFRLLEFPGAALIAGEMEELITVIADPDRKTTDLMINAITHAYFVLPRYLEYVAVKQAELPILMIPYANELRVSRRAELLPEYYFYTEDIPVLGLLEVSTEPAQLPILLAAAPRLRHMFQTGLVGVIRDPNSSMHFQFMRRSITRFLSLLGNYPHTEIWQLASAALEAFVAANLEVTLNRKRMLGDIEKMMRKVVSEGEAGLSVSPPENLKKDLLFLIMLTDVNRPEIDSVRQCYSLADVGGNDAAIVSQRNAMHGPSIDTMESVIKVLKEELRSAKDILEIASQNNGIELEDLYLLKAVILRVADTLTILNLAGPRQSLQEALATIEPWAENSPDSEGFLRVADTVLYVESALSGLDRREFTVDELNEASVVARKKVIACGQLAEAEQVVIEEAQSGISLAKRAITSYVDSNFDAAHIANVATTLSMVRGGLHILKYRRAASVLKSCRDFVANHVNEGGQGAQRHQMLETLADALISLEYYLVELETSRNVNEGILDVAEESLAALGFAVEK